MALATKTLSTLIQKLAESNSDYLSFSTTTNIAADNYVISTTLGQYDESEDDHFGGADTHYWIYIAGTANVGVLRRTSDYSAASTRVTIEGAALAAESGAATCQIFRYNRDSYKNAIIEACNEIYPALHVKIDDQTLITGNVLPDAHFESWASASTSNWWRTTNCTVAQTTRSAGTSGFVRGSLGTYAAKVTASAANGYISIDSDHYPRLLDLMDKTVNFYIWAYPEVADDPWIRIYTRQAAGSTQTLTSDTSSYAIRWNELKLESQTLNDNLEYLDIRVGITTNAKYCYFDDAYLNGMNLSEYLLPDEFIEGGHLNNVYIQEKGHSDEPFYDMHPFTPYNSTEIPFDIINDGLYQYLKTELWPSERRLRLLGIKPLETLSADTDTLTLDTHRVPLLIARAKMIFWEREAAPITSQDKARFEFEYAKAERDYRRLLRLRMPLSAEMRGL